MHAPELDEPEVNEAFLYLWYWFEELAMARTGNGFGMNLLSYTEIDAWARLTHRALHGWEVSVLKTLDVLCVSLQGKKK